MAIGVQGSIPHFHGFGWFLMVLGVFFMVLGCFVHVFRCFGRVFLDVHRVKGRTLSVHLVCTFVHGFMCFSWFFMVLDTWFSLKIVVF